MLQVRPTPTMSPVPALLQPSQLVLFAVGHAGLGRDRLCCVAFVAEALVLRGASGAMGSASGAAAPLRGPCQQRSEQSKSKAHACQLDGVPGSIAEKVIGGEPCRHEDCGCGDRRHRGRGCRGGGRIGL